MSSKPYHLAVRAVIENQQGQCLLLRRSNTCRSFAGKWEWPGGKADEGETFETALLREVREETGLEVEITGVAGAYGFEMTHIRLVVLCMETTVTGGTFKISDEHDDFAWVSIKDLLSWDIIDGLKELATQYAVQKGENYHG